MFFTSKSLLMCKFLKVTVLLHTILIYLNINNLFAQSRHVFDSIDFGIQMVSNVNHNDFHNYWESKTGINISAKAPFYFGDALLGLQLSPYKSIENNTLDFYSLFIHAGWGVNVNILQHGKWFNGICLGGELMDFGKSENRYSRFETEFAISLNSQLVYNLNEKVAINISAAHKIIYTYKKIKLSFISCGINYSVPTPKWIKDFLE